MRNILLPSLAAAAVLIAVAIYAARQTPLAERLGLAERPANNSDGALDYAKPLWLKEGENACETEGELEALRRGGPAACFRILAGIEVAILESKGAPIPVHRIRAVRPGKSVVDLWVDSGSLANTPGRGTR